MVAVEHTSARSECNGIHSKWLTRLIKVYEPELAHPRTKEHVRRMGPDPAQTHHHDKRVGDPALILLPEELDVTREMFLKRQQSGAWERIAAAAAAKRSLSHTRRTSSSIKSVMRAWRTVVSSE